MAPAGSASSKTEITPKQYTVTARSLRKGPTGGHMRGGKHWKHDGQSTNVLTEAQLQALKTDPHIAIHRIETVGEDGAVEVLASNFTAGVEKDLARAMARIKELEEKIESEGASFRAEHYPLQTAHAKLQSDHAALKTELANALEKIAALEKPATQPAQTAQTESPKKSK